MQLVVLGCLLALVSAQPDVPARSWTFHTDWVFQQAAIKGMTISPSLECPDLALSTFRQDSGPAIITTYLTPIQPVEIPCTARKNQTNSSGCQIRVDWRAECILSCPKYCPYRFEGDPNAKSATASTAANHSTPLICLPHSIDPKITYCQPRPPGYFDSAFVKSYQANPAQSVLVWASCLFTAGLILFRIHYEFTVTAISEKGQSARPKPRLLA